MINRAKLYDRIIIYRRPAEDAMDSSASVEVEYRPSFKPGSLAEREHRKWTEKAIVMANNPYSR